MSANVETMFSVRETPWHGLGKVIDTAPTSIEALKLAGLDWNVIQKPVYANTNGFHEEIVGYKVNVRDSDQKVLGLVTNKYRIVQNKDAFSFTDALLGEGVVYETAGSLASGKRVWMLARMPQRLITDEKVDSYLVFTNSHDGKGSVRVAITPVRVVCQNTLNLALNNASRHWSCVHTGNIDSKLEDARETLLNAKVYMDALEENFGELKLKKMTKDKVKEYVDLLIPLDEDASDRQKANISDLRTELMNRYLYAPDLEYMEHSAFRFVNAVSDFATHKEPARHTQNYQENMFLRTVDGNPLIDTAYEMVAAL